MMSVDLAMSLLEKSLPIQLCDIIEDGTLMTRLIFGLKVHMLWSFSKVALPASRAGATTRTRESTSPLFQESIVMVRSQSGRWMVMVMREWDDRPRQWSMALRINSRAAPWSACTGPASSSAQRHSLTAVLQLLMAMAYNSGLSF